MSTHSTTPTPPDTVDWAFVTEGPCAECGFAPGLRELSAAETLRASAASWPVSYTHLTLPTKA